MKSVVRQSIVGKKSTENEFKVHTVYNCCFVYQHTVYANVINIDKNARKFPIMLYMYSRCSTMLNCIIVDSFCCGSLFHHELSHYFLFQFLCCAWILSVCFFYVDLFTHSVPTTLPLCLITKYRCELEIFPFTKQFYKLIMAVIAASDHFFAIFVFGHVVPLCKNSTHWQVFDKWQPSCGL